MKPIKADHKEMVTVLSEPLESVDDAAQKALEAAYALYEGREHYGLLYHVEGRWVVRGGFSTIGQAGKWAEKNGHQPGEAVVVLIALKEEE